jgi:hypothetical protein
VEFTLTYTPEQESFREEVREWLGANVPDGLRRRPASPDESREQYLRRRELGRKLGTRGWLYPAAPPEYGGGGLDDSSILVLQEEMHRLDLDLPPYYDSGGLIGSSTILVWGTEEQKQQLLPPIYRGEVRTWQLLTEPQAGSDLAAVRLSARADGDHWVLNGQKIWIGSAHGTDRLWVLAMTDPAAPRHDNLGWFMIDANLPGISTQPQFVLADHGEGSGDEGHKNSVFFDNVRVPADALIGGANNGWRVATTHLEVEHGALGMFRQDHTWDRLLAYCRTRTRDGRPLLEHDDIRDGLADIYARTHTMALLGQRNFWLRSSGRRQTYEGSQLVYLTKTTGLWLTQAILDVLGPAALTNDAVRGAMAGYAELQAREGIVAMHPGGTADIQRVIISRRLGVGGRQPEKAGRLS